jgi:hemoglobin
MTGTLPDRRLLGKYHGRLLVVDIQFKLVIKLKGDAMKNDIKNLDDIVLFVDEFYNKVQRDNLIGPIFNDTITDWGPHLEKMYRFWNAALFSVPGFKGNPFAKHAPLPIEGKHFDRWLELFNATIDENFDGEMVKETKNRALLMADMFLNRLQNMRGGPGKVIV